MSWLLGALKLDDADRTRTVSNIGQAAIFTATQDFLARINADRDAAAGVFVERTTDRYTERYYLPGGGYLQRRGRQTQTASVKAGGYWDVGYPLEDFGAQISGDDVSLAYMTLEMYQRHVDTVVIQDVNTFRFEILKALVNSTAGTFVDPINGSLTIQRLANGDATLFPPLLGTNTEATDTHYLESGYAASAISDANNPFVTIKDEIEEHFGTDGNIAVFVNNAQVAKTEALTDFDPVNDANVRAGANEATVINVPAALPGRVIGRTNGVWVVEWRYLPANYMIGIDLSAPAPLVQRVDPASTGLGMGLQLVAEDEIYPFRMAHWRHRFGFGVGNRLNGVVMELGTGGTYSVPSGF
jgi:hypothetical protein